jgi:crossover junction endodeoxyribonuclease RuvC
VTRHVLGIDPGFTGAIALLGDKLEVWDAPVLEVNGRRQMDLHAMVRIYRDFVRRFSPLPHVFIERVHSMPGSSPRSMFTFGEGYGAWQGMAVALDFPLTRIEPARWKAAMMDGMGKDKDAARLRAALLFPTYAHLFARKQDDGRAEACLIAEYGRRTT